MNKFTEICDLVRDAETVECTSELPGIIKEIRDICEQPALPRKEVISIQPGDKIAIMHPGVLSEKGYATVKKGFTETFPGTECLILEEGMTMEVYREQDLKMVDGRETDIEQVKKAFRSHPENKEQEPSHD